MSPLSSGINVLLLLLLCLPASGQEYEYDSDTRYIGQLDGLSHYRILSFLPERDGMWIGTEDGLNFFDGNNWQYWNKEEGHFSDGNVSFLLKDQDDFLWIFHTKEANEKDHVLSIDLLSPTRDSVYSVVEKPGSPLPFQIGQIQQFFGDSLHHLYFFADGQLWQYSQQKQFQRIALPSGFVPHYLFPDGTFVGRLKGMLTLVSASGEILQLNYPLEERYFQLLGTTNRFWVWQDRQACKVYQRQEDKAGYSEELFPFQPQQTPFSLLHYSPSKEVLWITKADTTYLLDRQGKPLYQTSHIPRRVVLDQDGNYWFGKYEVIVLRLQKRKFKRLLYQTQVSYPDNAKAAYQCRGLLEKNGQLFVATYGGIRLVDLSNGQVSELPTEKERFFSLMEDQASQLWMGYNDLVQLDEKGNSILQRYPLKGTGMRTWSLFEDSTNRIWMGHRLGLSYVEDDQVTTFSSYNGFTELDGALVIFFYEDREGLIWVGSGEGLFVLDLEKGITTSYGEHKDGTFYLPSKRFQHMTQDSEGIYWLATEDAGLIRWDIYKGEVRQYDKNWGMLTNNIYSVYEDDYGYLWMSSFNGLIRFHKATEAVQFFHEEDGISHNEFNRISHHQGASGRFYFGSQNGVTCFHPRDFLNDPIEHSQFALNIEHVSIIGKKIQTDFWENGDPINLMALPPKTRIIDLEIGGSNSFWTGNVALHHTLERLEGDESTSSRENITHTSHIELFEMPPGIYTLSIRAVQQNGKPIGSPLVVPIKILLPFYQTFWFWGIVAVFLLLASWGFTKWRIAHLQRQKAALEILVSQRTNQILESQKTIDDQARIIESMQTQLNQKDQEWLKQFQSIIQERLGDPSLYLPDIIDDMEISRTAFYEKVKHLTRMTPNQYIQELRLVKAKSILEAGSAKTVKEVALSVGMKQPKYFSKLFKERFGMLPSTYFRELRK